ncbi:MAG: hypothetical protein QXY07_04600 [Candidatus Bathyarchaeia archaeon]
MNTENQNQNNNDNLREDDKKPQGVLSDVGSNPTPGAQSLFAFAEEFIGVKVCSKCGKELPESLKQNVSLLWRLIKQPSLEGKRRRPTNVGKFTTLCLVCRSA